VKVLRQISIANPSLYATKKMVAKLFHHQLSICYSYSVKGLSIKDVRTKSQKIDPSHLSENVPLPQPSLPLCRHILSFLQNFRKILSFLQKNFRTYASEKALSAMEKLSILPECGSVLWELLSRMWNFATININWPLGLNTIGYTILDYT